MRWGGSARILSEDDVAGVIAQVGELITLPEGETPTVASVADLDKLRDQPFFAYAEVGDRVLIYRQAKKAYLYRPSINKLIEVAPVVVDASASASATPAARAPRFVLLNGTNTSGLAARYADTLEDVVVDAEIVTRDDAVDSYASSMLVDLSGTHAEEGKALAETLGMSFGELPEAEVAPGEDADFLIILGEDVVQ
jgi:hypothetical protein